MTTGMLPAAQRNGGRWTSGHESSHPRQPMLDDGGGLRWQLVRARRRICPRTCGQQPFPSTPTVDGRRLEAGLTARALSAMAAEGRSCRGIAGGLWHRAAGAAVWGRWNGSGRGRRLAGRPVRAGEKDDGGVGWALHVRSPLPYRAMEGVRWRRAASRLEPGARAARGRGGGTTSNWRPELATGNQGGCRANAH